MSDIDTRQIISCVSNLLEQEDVRVSLSHTSRAGIIAGLCTVAGGIVGGRTGLVVGGLAGTAITAFLTPNFVPLSQVIQSRLDEEQKRNLAMLVQSLVRAAPGVSTLSAAMANSNVKAALIKSITNYVKGLGICES